nr:MULTISPECIES: UPF0715 family protein [Bacillus]
MSFLLHRFSLFYTGILRGFRSRDLLIYFIAAWVVCSALALWIDYGLVVFISYKVYLFSFCAALIYWVLDSVFLMENPS